ncbi:TPA: hypothetical protein EYP44_05290 [Candidatus Bathyarchaeota archaeon]|nr:hypothetical protein [Candidatus Bathyarchaeota archaeon]
MAKVVGCRPRLIALKLKTKTATGIEEETGIRCTDRLIFPRGRQRDFIYSVKRELHKTWAELYSVLKQMIGEECRFSLRTLKGWAWEQQSLPVYAAVPLCRLLKKPFSKTIGYIDVRPGNWGCVKGEESVTRCTDVC